MSSFIEIVADAITCYFSLLSGKNEKNEVLENDRLHPNVIENITSRDDGIQILRDIDVDILSDIKQNVPFAPTPCKKNVGMEWCREKGEFIYLNDTNRSEQVLNRIRDLNAEEQEKSECLSESSNISDLTTVVCAGSHSEPSSISFQDIDDDVNDSLFLRNVWSASKL